MNREQMIAWLTLEGWQPVRDTRDDPCLQSWRGFRKGNRLYIRNSPMYRFVNSEQYAYNPVGEGPWDASSEPEHNLSEADLRYVITLMEAHHGDE